MRLKNYDIYQKYEKFLFFEKLIKILLFFSIVLIIIFYLKSNSELQQRTIRECSISENKYALANFSKYDMWEDEFDYWETMASNYIHILTVNGVLMEYEGQSLEKITINKSGYYSSDFPDKDLNLSNLDNFDNYENVIENKLIIKFDYDKFETNNEQFNYKNCLLLLNKENGVNVNTFKDKVFSIK